jgi:hypothetical protein
MYKKITYLIYESVSVLQYMSSVVMKIWLITIDKYMSPFSMNDIN